MLSSISLRAELRRILILTTCVVLLSGCGSSISNSSPTPNPISTPTFGSTPTPLQKPSPTPKSKLTPTFGSTPTPLQKPSPTPNPISTPTFGSTPTPLQKPSPTPTPTPSPTQTITQASPTATVVNQDGTTAPNKGPVSINVAGLNIYSSEGIQCPLGAPTIINYFNAIRVSDQLVLETARLTYSQEEIQQMTEYLQSIFTSGNTASSFITSPPATLLWVPGAVSCDGAFQITNVGNTTIQVSTVGIEITREPQQNSYKYRTIDACTLLPISDTYGTQCSKGGPSGGGSCSIYYANIHLQDAKANSVFTDTPFASAIDKTCPELTINPGATTDLDISFDTGDTPESFIYSVIPELTVSNANGTQVISLPQLASTLAFANTSQISCYGLQDNTFALEQPHPPPSAPIQYCM